MKKFIFMLLVSFLFLSNVSRAQAQSSSSTESSSLAFDMTGFPQWAKDMRRWDIVAFGAYPFALFFTTTYLDLSGSSTGDMSNKGYGKILLQAGAVSAAVASIDLIIVLIKRSIERKRTESKPKSSADIEIKPYGDQSEEDAPETNEEPDTGQSGKN